MKFRKTISLILLLIVIGSVSRVINIYSVKYLDARFSREDGVIRGTQEFYIEKGKDAVLLLHGLTANPHSVKEIGIFLVERGYTVYAPVIKGHGTSVFDLEKTNYLDWYNSAETAYLKLASNHDKVYIIGTSLGGLIALDLASNYDADGLIVVNAPIEIKSEFTNMLPLVYLVSPYSIRGLFTLQELPIAVDLKLYDTLPLKSAAQLVSYLNHVKPKINNVDEPILVVQSLKDDIVNPESADYIMNNVNSSKKELLLLKDSTHINIVTSDKELLEREGYAFIKNA